MEILIKAAQLILSLSILVIFHEFGHFLFAKLFGTRVEKFYLFFNAGFSLFKFKRGETEYGMGWIPLGGYVKISGMIDESMDKEQMKKPPEPHEFRAKPAWQRLLIMSGGVLVNFLLAIAIYMMVMMVWGKSYLPPENAKYGVVTDTIAKEAGLQTGDKILALNGNDVKAFTDITPKILLNDIKTITVERNDKKKKIELPDNIKKEIIKKKRFVSLGFPFIVRDFSENSPAQKAGLKKGDTIIGLNDKKLKYFAQYPPALNKHKDEEVVVSVKRDGEKLQIPVNVSDNGKLGVYPVADFNKFFNMKEKKYNIIEAVPAGINKGYEEVTKYLKQFKLIFQPETEAYKSVGGFIAIGKIFPGTWNWYSFWMMTALLSIMLGVINFLPIPALDGGHVMFLGYEIISGRKPGEKFMEIAQITGMIFLLFLIIYANGNDIMKLLNN